jgi:hypothetical protein
LNYNEILTRLAPCGLDCSKCFAYSEGEIRSLSAKLEQSLGAFDRYAERFSAFSPIFSNYPSFKKLLAHLGQANCLGCRKGACLYPNCGVMSCHKEKRVDFCFQCREFPCHKSNFDPDLRRRWIQMNTRMKEIGVEAYYEEIKDEPRYK